MEMPWDELNVIRSKAEKLEIEETAENGKKKYNAERVTDIVYEYLEYAWTMGVDNANEEMSASYAPQDAEMRREINRKVAGKDYKERIDEWSEKGDLDAIMRVAETDAHRMLNESAYMTAKKAGAKTKKWVCTFHNSRDTHMDLHGQTVGIDDYFVTFNGHKTLYPGEFGIAEEDCNCQCYLRFK